MARIKFTGAQHVVFWAGWIGFGLVLAGLLHVKPGMPAVNALYFGIGISGIAQLSAWSAVFSCKTAPLAKTPVWRLVLTHLTAAIHTLAIAREAGITYDIKRIDTISRRVPCVCKVSPSSNYHVQDVHRAGGIHTILGELKRMNALTLTCKTVTGKTLGENIDEWDMRSESCSAWAKAARVSGCSALVLDPNDKLGPAARTASGNLAPKPMMRVRTLV